MAVTSEIPTGPVPVTDEQHAADIGTAINRLEYALIRATADGLDVRMHVEYLRYGHGLSPRLGVDIARRTFSVTRPANESFTVSVGYDEHNCPVPRYEFEPRGYIEGAEE